MLTAALEKARGGQKVLIWAASHAHKRELERMLRQINVNGGELEVTFAVLGEEIRARAVKYDAQVADHYTNEVLGRAAAVSREAEIKSQISHRLPSLRNELANDGEESES